MSIRVRPSTAGVRRKEQSININIPILAQNKDVTPPKRRPQSAASRSPYALRGAQKQMNKANPWQQSHLSMMHNLNYLSSNHEIFTAFDPKKDKFNSNLVKYAQESHKAIYIQREKYKSEREVEPKIGKKFTLSESSKFKLLQQFQSAKNLDQIYDIVYDLLVSENLFKNMDPHTSKQRRQMVLLFFKQNPQMLIDATNILDGPKFERKVSKPKFDTENLKNVPMQQIEQMNTEKINRLKSAYCSSAAELIYVNQLKQKQKVKKNGEQRSSQNRYQQSDLVSVLETESFRSKGPIKAKELASPYLTDLRKNTVSMNEIPEEPDIKLDKLDFYQPQNHRKVRPMSAKVQTVQRGFRTNEPKTLQVNNSQQSFKSPYTQSFTQNKRTTSIRSSLLLDKIPEKKYVPVRLNSAKLAKYKVYESQPQRKSFVFGEKIFQDLPSVGLEAYLQLPKTQRDSIQIDWAHSHFFKNFVQRQSFQIAFPGTGDDEIFATTETIPQQKQILKLIKYLKEQFKLSRQIQPFNKQAENFQQHLTLGMQCLKNVFECLGISYLYKPIPNKMMDYLTVINLLKHCYGLLYFRDQLCEFLTKIENLNKNKAQMQNAFQIPRQLENLEVVNQADKKYQDSLQELQELSVLLKKLQTNYYMEKIFGVKNIIIFEQKDVKNHLKDIKEQFMQSYYLSKNN